MVAWGEGARRRADELGDNQEISGAALMLASNVLDCGDGDADLLVSNSRSNLSTCWPNSSASRRLEPTAQPINLLLSQNSRALAGGLERNAATDSTLVIGDTLRESDKGFGAEGVTWRQQDEGRD